MTGWRLGWLIARSDLAAKATELNEFIVSHAPTFTQKAGETALAEGEAELRRMLERLKENRDLCLDALRGIAGVTVPTPGWRLLSVSTHRWLAGFLRLLQASAGRDARRPGTGCSLWRRRGRFDPYLLCGGSLYSGACHGTANQFF